MKKYLLLVFICGCAVQPKAPTMLTRMSSAQSEVIAPHYHTVSWTPAHWTEPPDNPIEYDLLSTVDMHAWFLESRTMDTNAFVTNDFPIQAFIVGAHAK